MVIRVVMSTRRNDKNKDRTRAAMTAAIAATVVFIHARARYSSGRRRMWAFNRFSSSSWSSTPRAWTKAPKALHASCSRGVRLTLTGFAPFGSFTRWCPFSASSSPGRKRFVRVRDRRVSSFSNAVLPNGLTSCRGSRSALIRPSHLIADAFRGLLGVLVVGDDDLRDFAEVQDIPLRHVVHDVNPSLELFLHLLMGHVLHLHDLVEEEGVSLVHERVRGGIPFVHRVRDEFVRFRLKPDELDDLLDSPDDGVADPGVGLVDKEVKARRKNLRV